MKTNNARLSVVLGSVNGRRSFLSNQAHQLIAGEREHGRPPAAFRDTPLLKYCTANLKPVAHRSKQAAAPRGAQAIEDVSRDRSYITLDINRSTNHSLFVVKRTSCSARVHSVAELVAILNVEGAVQTSRESRLH